MKLLAAGDLLGSTEDWMAVVDSAAPTAVTTPTDPSMQGGKGVKGPAVAKDCTLTGSGTISSSQVVELGLSQLPSAGVGHLINRGCGLSKEHDTLIVEATALQTQQRYVHMQCMLMRWKGMREKQR